MRANPRLHAKPFSMPVGLLAAWATRLLSIQSGLTIYIGFGTLFVIAVGLAVCSEWMVVISPLFCLVSYEIGQDRLAHACTEWMLYACSN